MIKYLKFNKFKW